MGAGGIELGAAFGPPCFFGRDVEGGLGWSGEGAGEGGKRVPKKQRQS